VYWRHPHRYFALLRVRGYVAYDFDIITDSCAPCPLGFFSLQSRHGICVLLSDGLGKGVSDHYEM
jgi:hypothetical protein